MLYGRGGGGGSGRVGVLEALCELASLTPFFKHVALARGTCNGCTVTVSGDGKWLPLSYDGVELALLKRKVVEDALTEATKRVFGVESRPRGRLSLSDRLARALVEKGVSHKLFNVMLLLSGLSREWRPVSSGDWSGVPILVDLAGMVVNGVVPVASLVGNEYEPRLVDVGFTLDARVDKMDIAGGMHTIVTLEYRGIRVQAKLPLSLMNVHVDDQVAARRVVLRLNRMFRGRRFTDIIVDLESAQEAVYDVVRATAFAVAVYDRLCRCKLRAPMQTRSIAKRLYMLMRVVKRKLYNERVVRESVYATSYTVVRLNAGCNDANGCIAWLVSGGFSLECICIDTIDNLLESLASELESARR